MKIEQKMDRMGFSEQLAGTAMLRVGIALYDRQMAFTKELYPAIAREFGTTAGRAERNMRHALIRAWEANYGEPGRLEFFGPSDHAPTVGEFVARMARGV